MGITTKHCVTLKIPPTKINFMQNHTMAEVLLTLFTMIFLDFRVTG